MKNQKAALGFIFITVLIDVIGLGIIIPVIPKLIMELSGEDISQASRYGGLLMFIYAFMQLFVDHKTIQNLFFIWKGHVKKKTPARNATAWST